MTIDRLERGLTLILAASALAMAATAARHEFYPAAQRRIPSRPPTFEPEWREALRVGLRTGDTTAPVTIVVFSDLECPACAAFHSTLREVVRGHERDVAVVFVHFPLTIHRFAVPAARAAECAASRGKFAQFEDLVYDKQDSLGIKSWGSYARDAGISDTAAIAACARDSKTVNRIDAGRSLAVRWELRGTPTVLINGQRYEVPPSREEMEQVIRRETGSLRKDAPQ